ncbi:hypothetical protein RRG08_043024 [Elysia crispata]|uniref:Uncharacterized protein n=1 Tax=Elysia crispata TaxID=231223 RepID=A0AAE0XYI1_9GAST|nr:hypothetical protein RRG08_043024 [Elysia crispata]
MSTRSLKEQRNVSPRAASLAMYLYNSSGCNGHRRHSYRSLNTACAIGIHFVVIQVCVTEKSRALLLNVLLALRIVH